MIKLIPWLIDKNPIICIQEREIPKEIFRNITKVKIFKIIIFIKIK
jgi:hypothetical protein